MSNNITDQGIEEIKGMESSLEANLDIINSNSENCENNNNGRENGSGQQATRVISIRRVDDGKVDDQIDGNLELDQTDGR